MAKIKRILFPVDLSPQCRAVVPRAKAMAKSFRSELVLLNVLEAPSGYSKDWNAYMTLVNWEAIRKDRERALAAFAGKAFKGFPVTYLMDEGDPGPAIVKFARKTKVDLIMMPTHGYGPFRSLLIGSVTAKVLHDTEIPVWTNAHSSDPSSSAATTYKRILCAVDATKKSLPLLRWADQFARHFKSTLRVVHAIPGADAVDVGLQSFLLSTAEDELVKLQRAAGINVKASAEIGKVGAVIRQEALKYKADLVVIGRGHLSGKLGRLRTNAYAVIRQSPCPVISV